MKACSLSLLVALFLCPVLAADLFAACPGNLNDVINTPNFGYEERYTNDNPPPAVDPDYFSDTQAQRAADALDDHHQSFLNLGFLAPFFNTSPPEVCCYDSLNIGGADFCQITLDTPFLLPETEPCIRLVAGHELFHHVQYAYINNGSTSCGGCGGTWGKWSCEGTARLMQDKIYTDLDQNAGCITYLEEINDYLASPNTTLTSASYKAALFWNYLTEQLGTISTEPELGSDVIETYWGNTDPNNPDSMEVLRDTIDDYAPTSSLEEIFHDFTITNYTKEFDVSALPDADKYFYIDETPTGGGTIYDPVARTSVVFSNSLSSSSVNNWAARYFEVDVGAPAQCEIIGFRGEASGDDADFGWTVIGIKAPDRVVELHKGRGKAFYKAFLNDPSDPFVKLAAVVTGLNEGGNFDYVFARAAPQTTNVQILRPTLSRQAYVGEHAQPDRFQIRLQVTGPAILTPSGSGTISVKGLSKENFTVLVYNDSTFSEEATVLTAAYVGGQYWLSCQAPVADPSNGTIFHLRVCLCGLNQEECATSRYSVVYAKLIRNEMLVIDRSGSMSLPSTTPKIDAAQAAANIYVDAAADNDLLGVVSFTGDLLECNDDSTLERNLLVVNDANRIAAKDKIDDISAGGWTGLGDGLNRAQDRLEAIGNPFGVDHIVLLSDGMENEALCWDSASPYCNNSGCGDDVSIRFTTGSGSGTIIDAIAFGPQTDQSLMQDIADTGTGDYFYVDVSETSALTPLFSAAAETPEDLTIGNRISEVYLAINDKIQGKDRIFFAAGTAAAGRTTSVPIPLTEGKTLNATFAVNWEAPGAVQQVRLYDPNNKLIGAGDAQIFTDDTHVVYQFKSTIPGGTWRVEMVAKSTTQYMVTLSGKFIYGVRADMYFGQVPPTTRCYLLPSKYLAGLPVTILVSLADIKGGIEGAAIEAEVTSPDRQKTRVPLFDDGQHDDGDAGDGIYGNVYRKTAFFSNKGVPEDQAEKNPGTRGSYGVFVTAKGVSHAGERFTRFLNRAFQVYECWYEDKPDWDNDGMPNRYEDIYGCLDPQKPDSDQDPDMDGLKNIEEYYRLGTNPCDRDTDDGGEMDGSEVKRGANPLDPRDDRFPRPVDVEVITTLGDEDPTPLLKPNTNTIRYPSNAAYSGLRLFRGTSPRLLNEVARIDPAAAKMPGIYFDEKLTNDVTYYYQLIAVGKSGEESTPSPIFSGTPKEDPIPPKGWVSILKGAVATTSPKVVLTFDTDRDNAEVMVSNEPTFAGNKWISNPWEMGWLLAPDPETGRATVYVKFRDEAGNESVTYHDSIIVDPDGDLDNDGIPDEKDNCPAVPNKDQVDRDKDGVGDACDNCPKHFNPDQRDRDFDGVGDACECEGDFDKDGDVDGSDLAVFAADFGRTNCAVPPPCEGDFDRDGDVDGSDLAVFAKDFGRTDCTK